MKAMMVRTLALLILSALPVMGQMPAGTTNRYTLSDCLRIGLEKSASALNARSDQTISEAVIKQVRSQAFPKLALDASYTRLDEIQEFDVGEGSVAMGTEDNYSVTASLNQLLYSGGKVKAALDSQETIRLRAKAVRQDTEARLVHNIKKLFYDILLLQSTVEVRRDSVLQLSALVKQTEDRFRAKTTSEFDLISAQVKLANERPSLISAEGRCALAHEALRRLVSLDDGPFTLAGTLAFTPHGIALEDIEKEALEVRPGLRAMAALVELTAADIKSARSQGMPQLNAFFKYNGANSYGFASFEDEWQWHWNAGLTASWDVWDSGLTGGKVEEKKLILEKSRTDLDDLKKAVHLELIGALLHLDEARARVKTGRENAALAEKGLTIAKARMDEGLGTYLEFSDANLGVKIARLGLLVALRDHMAGLAELEYAAGMTLDEMEKLKKEEKSEVTDEKRSE